MYVVQGAPLEGNEGSGPRSIHSLLPTTTAKPTSRPPSPLPAAQFARRPFATLGNLAASQQLPGTCTESAYLSSSRLASHMSLRRSTIQERRW